jgi:ABC-type multidrug transport system fused ATPase/permease subunit
VRWLASIALPAAVPIAALHLAGLLAIPGALFVLGSATPWYVPLLLGWLLGAARGFLVARIRRRVRPTLFARATELALGHTGGVSEAYSDAVFWTAELAESAILHKLPAAIAEALAGIVTLVLAAARLGVRIVIPLVGLAGVILVARELVRRRVVRLLEREFAARNEVAIWIAAAARDAGEITGGRARRHLLARVGDVAHAWSTVEERRNLQMQRDRLLLRLAAVAGLVLIGWAAAGLPPRSLLRALSSHTPLGTLQNFVLLVAAVPIGLSFAHNLDDLAARRDRLRVAGVLDPLPPSIRHEPFPTGSPEIAATALTVRYGEQVGLADVTFRVPAAGLLAIIGPNGSGKSTLARALAGSQPASAGTLTIGGVPTTRLDPESVAFVPQHPVLIEALTIADNVRLVATDATDEAVVEALRRLGLNHAPSHRVEGLSRGEQRRIAIARALLKDPRLLILDEPDAWLDATARDALCSLLRQESARRAVVVVTHRAEMMRAADRVLALSPAHTLEAVGSAAQVVAQSESCSRLVADSEASHVAAS